MSKKKVKRNKQKIEKNTTIHQEPYITVEKKNKQGKSSSQKINPTGIEGLDKLLGGGLPEGHVILLAGNSGTGKTVLTMQWLFAGYTKSNEPGIYLTLTEPITKSLKNVENTTFFNHSLISPNQIHFTDLRTIVKLMKKSDSVFTKKRADELVDIITNLVNVTKAKRVVIDSITAMAYMLNDKNLIRYFCFRLGTVLANMECTTILTSEVIGEGYSVFGVEEFISDGIIKLEQIPEKNGLRRKLQVSKMRGRGYDTQLVPFKIDEKGIRIFTTPKEFLLPRLSTQRISTGIDGINSMCGGGVFESSITLIAGSAGTGKTTASIQFLVEGLKKQEHCLFVSFEEGKEQLLRDMGGFKWDLARYEKEGLLTFLCYPPERNSFIDHILAIQDVLERKKVKRVVIDSLSAFRSVFPEEDYLNFIKQIGIDLRSKGITTFMTFASEGVLAQERLTGSQMSSFIDNIILQRYIEKDGRLSLMITLLKMRGSKHDRELRAYELTPEGIVIKDVLLGYEGLMSGTARHIVEKYELSGKKLSQEEIDKLIKQRKN